MTETKKNRTTLKAEVRAKLDDNRNRFRNILATFPRAEQPTYDNRATKRDMGLFMNKTARKASVTQANRLKDRYPYLTDEQIRTVADKAYWSAVLPNQTKTPLGSKKDESN